MKRIFFSLFFACVLGIAGLLFFQWKGYTSSNQAEKYIRSDQQFSILHKGSTFYFEGTITLSSVSQGKYHISWPHEAKDFSCKDVNDENCLTKENGSFHILAPKGTTSPYTITLSYTIDKSAGTNSLLLSNWYPIIQAVTVESTSIQLTEQSILDGTWISGFQSSYNKKMEFVDYYVFKGNDGPVDLLWTRESLQKKVYPHFSVYSKEEYNSFDKLEIAKELTNNQYVTIICSKSTPSFVSKRLIIINDCGSNIEKTQQLLNEGLIGQSFLLPVGQKGLMETMTSIVLERPVGGEKSQFMYKELVEGLTSEQFTVFQGYLRNPTMNVLNVSELDEIIRDITGYKTTFFTDNMKGEKLYPLLLKDSKELIVNNEEIQGLSILIYKQKQLVPFALTLESLGLPLEKITSDAYLVLKDGNTYRFYSDQDYFIYNEEHFGSYDKPLQKIENKLYIDLKWVKRLFEVEVEESEIRSI
ncbi:hypothetical protein [Bacillus seohaeanensis]|jgi:hypothetical protein|uniref:Uncharacterized protein n=1 Tax=Bacillus seohaeanensis TaxID=284580 RepID=A0ABW5RW64_9BACI